MTDQVALTLITKIKPEAVEPLKAVLVSMNNDTPGNPILPFRALPNVHFARFVILDAASDLDGQLLPPQLIFLSDADGSVDAHLEQVVDVAGDGLDQVYAFCEGYPSTERRTQQTRLAYLRSQKVDAGAIYINTRGRTVEQVRQEAWLREAIQEFLDSRRTELASLTPDAVRDSIVQFVASRDDLRWALSPLAADSREVWRERLHFAGGVALLVVVAPVALLALPAFVALLRFNETRDPAPRIRPSAERIRELASLEDHSAQNQFSALGYVKPGWFRRLLAIAIIPLANFGARHLYPREDLGGVKTIHFARWVFLDGRRRLLFASNYDGSLESYMDDFIDKVAWGLNAVFSNGVGYPRTNWLVHDGARDEEAFKEYIRTHQIPTQMWYAAYDQLTARNIANNAKIRAGLSGRHSPAEVEAWLRLL